MKTIEKDASDLLKTAIKDGKISYDAALKALKYIPKKKLRNYK